MAFGQKAPEKPKAPTFYLKPAGTAGHFAGDIGTDKGLLKTTGTGKIILEINGGEKNGGADFYGKALTNQWGDYNLFVIEGHFWFGKTMTTKYGEAYQLKQGKAAEDSAEWKAKKQATSEVSLDDIPFDGGAGSAGLAAPAGQPAGVSIKAGSVVGAAPAVGASVPKPPKPSNYKRT